MHVPTPAVNASGLRVALVTSRYHAEITGAMSKAARDAFARAGGAPDDLVEVAAPGTFELPVIAAAFANDTDVDAIVALGCVVTGETRHDRYIAQAVADGLMRVAVESGVPVAFGVLTVGNLDQARARAGGAKGDKGAEAMVAALETAMVIRAIHDQGEAP